jgi:hypothetical protein
MNPPSSEAGYAFWTVPGTPFAVTYSLGIFHEIDFIVNENYRRIPHGGIEIGGVLFGHVEQNAARIEAFRLIECEHALGPSFVLSDRDREHLKNQLEAANFDPELGGWEVIGWFISHTRSQLHINDRELGWFNEFFPGPGKITLLIKPERFQPTRFAFLVRTADGQIDREGSQKAIILPLPGRVAQGGEQPIPSIPAPPERPPAAPPAQETPKPPQRLPEFRPVSPLEDLEDTVVQPPRTGQAPLSGYSAEPQPQTEQEELIEPPSAGVSSAPDEAAPAAAPLSPFERWPSFEEIRRSRPGGLPRVPTPEPRTAYHQITRPTERTGKHPNARLTLVLLLAALLGCAVGYWGYTQLPPPAIPLSIQVQNSTLLIAWPPDQTRSVAYAALTVDNGAAIPLSPAQRTAGQIAVPITSGNMKVELVARHWILDSRGIVRYVTALQ